MMPECDVVITDNRAVYVNGTLITNVTDLTVQMDKGAKPHIVLDFTPTSIVYGDIPTSTLDAATDDRTPDDGSVDIGRAIARAQARRAGLNPDKHVQPAPAPAAPPKPVRRTPPKPEVPEAAERDMGEVMPTCPTKGCYREEGHLGTHR